MVSKPRSKITPTSANKHSRARAGYPPWNQTPGSDVRVKLPTATREALKGWAYREHKSLQHKIEEIVYLAVSRMILEKQGRRGCCPQCKPVPLPKDGSMCRCSCHREAA